MILEGLRTQSRTASVQKNMQQEMNSKKKWYCFKYWTIEPRHALSTVLQYLSGPRLQQILGDVSPMAKAVIETPFEDHRGGQRQASPKAPPTTSTNFAMGLYQPAPRKAHS